MSELPLGVDLALTGSGIGKQFGLLPQGAPDWSSVADLLAKAGLPTDDPAFSDALAVTGSGLAAAHVPKLLRSSKALVNAAKRRLSGYQRPSE